MQEYLKYHKSISDELIAAKDRVRSFIGSNHWGEDGRYKEIILMDVLKRMLPESVSIGTGFVMGDNNLTRQIDIIVYKSSSPFYFKKESFVIIPKECVLGIIEVKTNLSRSSSIDTVIKNAHENGELIGEKIFNGIFSYENEWGFTNRITNRIDNALTQNHGYINHISFGKDYFMKYWNDGHRNNRNNQKYYRFYKIENLSFGYFISNLIETVHLLDMHQAINGTFKRYLYPIEETKEAHKVKTIWI